MSDPVREVREIESTGAWLDWRRLDLTASRIAALFDAHPYLSRDELAAIMRADTSVGTSSVPDSAAMRRGRILEPAVAAALAEEHPEWALTKATTYHRLPEPRLGCTPDYWANDDGLVQCKTVAPQAFEKWRGQPPLAYTLQTLTELIVTGREWGILAVLEVSPSYPLHLWQVPRHAAAEQRILDAAAEWWRAFDAGEIAPAAPSDGLAEAFDDGSHIDLSDDPELPRLLTERESLAGGRRACDKRIGEIDYQIKNRIGPARTAWLPGWQITFATQHRKEFVTPAKDIRVLRIKATTEDEDVTHA
jgi:predicted phage-related endonuclease